MGGVPHLAKLILDIAVPPVTPVPVEDAKGLVEVGLLVAGVVATLQRPDGPVAVVADHVVAQAVEVEVVGRVLVEAKFGQDERARVRLTLLEEEAVKGSV